MRKKTKFFFFSKSNKFFSSLFFSQRVRKRPREKWTLRFIDQPQFHCAVRNIFQRHRKFKLFDGQTFDRHFFHQAFGVEVCPKTDFRAFVLVTNFLNRRAVYWPVRYWSLLLRSEHNASSEMSENESFHRQIFIFSIPDFCDVFLSIHSAIRQRARLVRLD